jgi:hypothetical protein
LSRGGTGSRRERIPPRLRRVAWLVLGALAVACHRTPSARPLPGRCEFHPFPLTCEHFSGCAPDPGDTTLDRECWVRVFLGVSLDDDQPCILIEQADRIEQLATMEADRTRRFPPTTPGLADAMQRHIAAYLEEVAAARALAQAALQGADDAQLAAGRTRLKAAQAAFDAAEKHFRTICR